MENDDQTIEGNDTKTTMKVPTELLYDFKHLTIDMKTTVTALIGINEAVSERFERH